MKKMKLIFALMISVSFIGCDFLEQKPETTVTINNSEPAPQYPDIKECAESSVEKIQELSEELNLFFSNENLIDSKFLENTGKKVIALANDLDEMSNRKFSIEAIESCEYAVSAAETIAEFTGDVKVLAEAMEKFFVENEGAERIVTIVGLNKKISEAITVFDEMKLFISKIKSEIADNFEIENENTKKKFLEDIKSHIATIDENFSSIKNILNEIDKLVENTEIELSIQKANKVFVEQLKKVADELHQILFEFLGNTVSANESNQFEVTLDGIVTKLISKTESDILDNTFEIYTDLRTCNEGLQEFLIFLKSDEKSSVQTNSVTVQSKLNLIDKINELIPKILSLSEWLVSEKQSELEIGITKKISELNKFPIEIKQLMVQPEFKQRLDDESYIQELCLYIKSEIDYVNEFIEKNDFQNLLNNKDFANRTILELQLILNEIELCYTQIQSEHKEVLKKIAAEEEARIIAEKEKAEREEAARKHAEEDAAAAEEAKRLLEEEVAKRLASEEEAKRVLNETEEEAKRLLAEEIEKRFASEDEAKKLLAEQETKRIETEEEAKRLLAEEEAKRIESEEEAKRLLAEEEAKRIESEEQAKKLLSEEEARRLAAEEAAQKLLADEAAKRLAAEEEAKKKLEEEEKKRQAAEEEAAREEALRREAEETIKRLEAELAYSKRDRKWTTVIYMAADNNLEMYAIQDINELESAFNDADDMNVLVLIDRSAKYDRTNDDWTDTRLFQIKTDAGGVNGTIKSRRIDCPDIDIYKTKETELDMGNPYTLSGLLNFAKREYKADHYALIIWGHGNGWRSALMNDDGQATSRAVANDEESGSYMSVPKLGSAVRGKGFDLIAFDTCFGAAIENFYELKDCSTYLIGAAGLIPSEGMEYSEFLTSYGKSDKSILSVANCIANSFQNSVSIVKANCIQSIANGINNLSKSIASTITTATERDKTRQLFFTTVKSYRKETYPSDFFLDMYSLAEKYSTSSNSNIKSLADTLMSSIRQGVTTLNSGNPQLGIYYGELVNSQTIASVHSSSYTNGSLSTDKSMFVQSMTGWVPTESGNTSLLDKLFNVVF